MTDDDFMRELREMDQATARREGSTREYLCHPGRDWRETALERHPLPWTVKPQVERTMGGRRQVVVFVVLDARHKYVAEAGDEVTAQLLVAAAVALQACLGRSDVPGSESR